MNKRVVAAFDFDGTLIQGDSLPLFLIRVFGPIKVLKTLFILTPVVWSWLTKKVSRRYLRARMLERLFVGLREAEIQKVGEQFAADLLTKYVRIKALNLLEWHKSQGHQCLLISASPDFYMHHVGRMMGFDAVVCTDMEIAFGKYTGKHCGEICWGDEKVRRLYALTPGERQHYEIFAYGDSEGDHAMLTVADHPSIWRYYGFSTFQPKA